MTTYTRRGELTSCDDCGQVVGSHWRNFLAHTAVHARRDQLTARAARVQAMGDELACDSTGSGHVSGAESDRLTGHEAAPITSRGLTAKTLEES